MSIIPKVAILRNSSVGNSSLILRMHKDEFNENQDPTIGATFIQLSRSGDHIGVWDTSGSERFKVFLPIYIREATIVLICFENFLQEHNTIKRYIENVKLNSPKSIITLVATKNDLHDNTNDMISDNTNDIDMFITSSKTGEGINELIEYLFNETQKAILRNPLDDDMYLDLEMKDVPKKCCF